MFLAIKKSPFLFIFALFTAAFLASLGYWQMDRGLNLEKQDLLKKTNFNEQVIKITGDEQLENGNRVKLTGRFIKEKIVLHDNRLNTGKSGYHVFSFFQLKNGNVVLVNRGWVKMNLDRRILPVITTPEELSTITGVIRYPVKDVYTLASEAMSNEFPLRVQTINIEHLSKASDLKLADYSVLLDSEIIGDHFDRNWLNLLPGKYMTANKHYAYSLQWFLLSLISIIIFTILIKKLAKDD